MLFPAEPGVFDCTADAALHLFRRSFAHFCHFGVNLFGQKLQNTSLAVATIVVIFIIGYILFCKADKLNKAR